MKKKTKIIGHCDLVPGVSIERHLTNTVYVSIQEAIFRESQGEAVELHFESTIEDEKALMDFRIKTQRRWSADRLSESDGWTRRVREGGEKC